MLVGALLMFAAASLPHGGKAIGDAANWLRAGDFPSTEWHKAAVTRYELMVDQAGKPVNCTVTETSGSPIIDKVACTSLVARATYSPAQDGEGHAIPQAIRGKLEWHPGSDDLNKHWLSADLSVTLPSMTRAQGRVSVVVAVIYGKSGQVERCAVTKRAPQSRLNTEACATAISAASFLPVRDSDGAITRGLREIEVVFSHGERRQVTVL